MRKPGGLGRAALAGVSLLIVGAAGGPAVAADATSSRQTAEAGGLYVMPRGDIGRARVAGKAGERSEAPRRSPTPDAELRRLKGLGGETTAAPAEKAAVVVGEVVAGPAQQALRQECVTNLATGSAPPDIHGAATPSNLVVVTNRDIGVYRKSDCAVVSRVPLRALFESFAIPGSETLFDPRVLYDRLNRRCLVTVESRNLGNTDQFLYVAGSTDSACTSWRRARFVLSRVSPAALFCKREASDFYDYPNAGYNQRRLVVAANNFPLAGDGFYASVLSIDTGALYRGGTVRAKCFRPGSRTANLAPAVVGDRNPTMLILSPGSGGGDSIRRWRLETSAAGPNGDALVATKDIEIPAWTAAPDAAQPNGQRLDALDGRFQSGSKQIGNRLWNVHAVNVGGFSRWRLYELSATGTGVLFSLTPTTRTCAGKDHLFNPSVDTNSASPGAPAFVTASRTCPSQATAGKAAHLIFSGSNSSREGWAFATVETSSRQFETTSLGEACNDAFPRGACRWGDYSSAQVDPSATGRAWGFNQLVRGGTTQFDWATRAGQVGR